ncbi:MAG: NAD(P)-dependent oxidoreductase [Candidatus Latescibacteria bacterium]|jgi:nucleoside-diphosphate-sugar epimerase|nr:NAD(P)-dependent oxidoreductase [Candidatus Latescibacterota bacterium]
MNPHIQNGIAVTGALGNLGWKLLCHLAEHSAAPRLVGLDLRDAEPGRLEQLQTISEIHTDPPQIDLITCDLSDWQDQRWRTAINEVSAVVHFAAKNPFPEATWDDATVSIDMTNNLSQAATDSPTLSRFVFATSNHVMGRYKDANLNPGELHTDLEAGVGTLWHTGQKDMDSTVYAVAKFAGERQCKVLSEKSDTSFVCVRIGWCQPGENRPATLSAAGTPTQQSDPDPTLEQTNRWFREMWLSNRDFLHLFERSLLADTSTWPQKYIVVNGMSNNANMAWDLSHTRQCLKYAPQDNVYA